MTQIAWKNYREWIESLIKDQKSYFYRGQRDSFWKLQTSFHRIADEFGLTMTSYLNLLPELQHYVCAHQNELLNLQDPYEFGAFLSLLQHHGFPTPLLDWTLSPYMAAYFAFREIDDRNPQSDYVKIFVFDAMEWEKTFEQPMDLRTVDKNYISVLRPFAKHNQRYIAQMGAYTVTNMSNMEFYISALEKEHNKSFLFSAEISVKERTKIMRDLALMGINEMTMFPGLDGMCRALKERFFSREQVGNTPSELIAKFKDLFDKDAPNNAIKASIESSAV